MKTKAQELIYCEGGTHCLGCGSKIEPWFSLRCQVCWQKQAETPRDTSFKAPTKSEDTRHSGRCVICAAPTFGAAIFCRFCELTSFANHQGRDLLSAEQKNVAILEGVCEKCKMRETQKNSKTCFWCNSPLRRKLKVWKCMSCPQPISKTGTQKNYQCNSCILSKGAGQGDANFATTLKSQAKISASRVGIRIIARSSLTSTWRLNPRYGNVPIWTSMVMLVAPEHKGMLESLFIHDTEPSSSQQVIFITSSI